MLLLRRKIDERIIITALTVPGSSDGRQVWPNAVRIGFEHRTRW